MSCLPLNYYCYYRYLNEGLYPSLYIALYDVQCANVLPLVDRCRRCPISTILHSAQVVFVTLVPARSSCRSPLNNFMITIRYVVTQYSHVSCIVWLSRKHYVDILNTYSATLQPQFMSQTYATLWQQVCSLNWQGMFCEALYVWCVLAWALCVSRLCLLL